MCPPTNGISDIDNVARQAWDVNIENCLASGPRAALPRGPMGEPSARRLGQPPHAPASRQLVNDVRALLVVARHRDDPLPGEAVPTATNALNEIAILVSAAPDRDTLAANLPSHVVPVRAAPLAHCWSPLAPMGFPISIM